MVPSGYAAPNPALNSTITRGQVLASKLRMLGFFSVVLGVGPVGEGAASPSGLLTLAQVEASGVVPDDLVHLQFSYAGNDSLPEVSVVEQLLAPGTVSAVTNIFTDLFPNLSSAQAEAKALTAVANLPAVAAALKTALA